MQVPELTPVPTFIGGKSKSLNSLFNSIVFFLISIAQVHLNGMIGIEERIHLLLFMMMKTFIVL